VSDPYVIVWDLDGTLGDFEALHARGECSEPITVKVRPGMAEALRTLTEEGFVHTLLTRAAPLYAEVALRAAGLRPFFVRVEGAGQRGKGDAVGIAETFGLAERHRPHRMFFVGDLPVFDEPRDPRIVFHLEPCFLSRSAVEVARLVLHLREVGGGSLRQGFDLLANPIRWWQWVIPLTPRMPIDRPVRCSVPAVGQLVLMVRKDGCPIVVFENPAEPAMTPTEHSFVPAEVIALVRAEESKADKIRSG
jgi:hypothetical protein